ncbi:MAG: hypothetical protein FJ087_10870 [Deltaproteobacteria bacterium]|nr:hypothetical protein [Deltaproteobacteria bacterium]
MRASVAIAVVAAGLVAACSSGGGGLPLEVAGRVVGTDGAGIEGVTVRCPAGGVEVATGAGGAFALSARVPAPEGDAEPRAALWFAKDGLAPIAKSVGAGEGPVAVVATVGKASKREPVTLPPGPDTETVFLDHGALTLYPDSFEAGGAKATGTADVTWATWDPTYGDALLVSALPVRTAAGTAAPYLEQIASVHFRAEQAGSTLAVGGAKGVGADIVTSGMLRDPLGPDDGLAFHVDELTGELVAKAPAAYDLDHHTLRVAADADGTWVWARGRVGSSTCVDVKVIGRDGLLARGAHLVLLEKSVTGGPDAVESVLDEAAGTLGESWCLRAPTGTAGGRLRVAVPSESGIEEVTVVVPLGSVGTCDAPCPNTRDVDLRQGASPGA